MLFLSTPVGRKYCSLAQLVRASDQSSEDPGLNPGWISMSFFRYRLTLQVKQSLAFYIGYFS